VSAKEKQGGREKEQRQGALEFLWMKKGAPVRRSFNVDVDAG
jgi:hypothetical protein